MVATLHDVLVTLAILTLFGYELSLNIIAAILTIAGYWVNDTDRDLRPRAREPARARREPLENGGQHRASTRHCARTMITAGTTFLAVLSLYLFGGEALEGFAFTMLVGIISSTYSTVFIASAIADAC